ncbi:MAG: radical SAM family heme chaperone HemW, partial [Bacilli bacterium]|nr:radical SAM family heme chaperone HemW [Bacilli bacterium]
SAYLDEGGEFSVEANPESLTKEKARLMKKCGVNRVSLGIQSSSPRLLAILGRKHTFADAEEAIALLKEQGIANINADMMYALPGESEAELMADIQAFLSLGVDHISAYSLILEDNTLFKAKGLSEAGQDEQGKSYETILQAFRDAGYERYEVSNFARNGRRCRHNLTYWKNEKYYGFGLGAASYLGNERRKNTFNLTAYLAGKTIVERETVSEKDELEYFLLCNLRLAEGFEPDVFAQKFGLPFEEKCPTAAELFQLGLLINEGNRVRASDYGLLTLDSILVKLFAD